MTLSSSIIVIESDIALHPLKNFRTIESLQCTIETFNSNSYAIIIFLYSTIYCNKLNCITITVYRNESFS
ncbi:hypothetical protein SXYLSMQ121_1951 [Staphylococcus xylosus]|nr:hypothetical protein SXYLSMQ121_1951 [Staphylococcus xylosus]